MRNLALSSAICSQMVPTFSLSVASGANQFTSESIKMVPEASRFVDSMGFSVGVGLSLVTL